MGLSLSLTHTPDQGCDKRLPEMCQVIIHRLLVEFIISRINNDGAVHVILDPVGSAFHVQGEVPVNPPRTKIVDSLQGLKAKGHTKQLREGRAAAAAAAQTGQKCLSTTPAAHSGPRRAIQPSFLYHAVAQAGASFRKPGKLLPLR